MFFSFGLDFVAIRAQQLKPVQGAVKLISGVSLDLVADHTDGILTFPTRLAPAPSNVIESERSFVGATQTAVLVKPSALRIGAPPAEYSLGFSFQFCV
jgi:hypothetical protein